MKKKIILVDMDGVLVQSPNKDYETYMKSKMRNKGVRLDGSEIHWSDVPGIFIGLKPMEGAIEAYNKLSENYELYIVSTAPWYNQSSWTDKLRWVQKYLPIARKRLFLTHNKHMVLGDYIIDDRLKNGVEKFPGTHIYFGQPPFENWRKVLEYFEAEGTKAEGTKEPIKTQKTIKDYFKN
jgi:5'(3')-deoxyribonucleotidase